MSAARPPERIRGIDAGGGEELFAAEGTLLRVMRSAGGPYDHSESTPDGGVITALTARQSVIAWASDRGSVFVGHSKEMNRWTIEAHRKAVRWLEFDDPLMQVASCSDDGSLKVWKILGAELTVSFEGHAGPVRSCRFLRNAERMVSCSADGMLGIWEGSDPASPAFLRGHARGVNACVVTDEEAPRIVSASDDRTLRVWSLDDHREVATLRGHRGPVLGCLLTPDGRHVLSWSMDRTLCLWSLETYRRVATTYGTAPLASAKLLPDGRVCALDAQGALWILRLAVEVEAVEESLDS